VEIASDEIPASHDTAGSEAPDWSLDLTPSRQVVRLGEPAFLSVGLTNRTSHTGRFPELLSPGYGFLTIQVRHPEAKGDVVYRSPLIREGRGKVLIELPPGATLSTLVPIFYDREGWFLDKEGTYEMRASLRWEDLRLHSPVVRMRVEPPVDARERAAAARFMTAGRFIFLNGGDPDGETTLREVAVNFPETSWARYAEITLELATHYSGNRANCARTVERLRSLLPQVEDPVFAVEAYAVLANCLRKSGHAEEAIRVYDDLVRTHPRADSLPGVRERLSRVER
jgi:hypothetical protein